MGMKNMRKGIPRIFREGYKQFSGIEESILNNIEAVTQFAEILKTSFGPNGLNKLIVNSIGKVYVTNDCITIVEQLSVEHPAAKVLIHAAAMQEREIGDGSNLVVIFGGELLKKAGKLIDFGIHPSSIIIGYEKAHQKLLELLETLVINTNFDVHSIFDLSKACSTAIASKCFGLEDFISTKVAEACSIAIPKNPLKFIVDNVRTLKILGSNVYQTEVINGMVHHQSKTNVKFVKNCKVLILTTNVGLREMDVTQNVVFNNSEDLLNFSKSEENIVKTSIENISKIGVKLLVLSTKPTDLETFYLNKYNIYTVVVSSKFGRRRLCRMFKARACVTKDWKFEDLGYVQLAKEIEIGGQKVTQFVQRPGESIISTIIIRGASNNVMDDLERAIHDGINTIRAMCRENHFVPGAGAVEIEISKKIQEYGEKFIGNEQYSIKSYAEALEVVPRTLASNSGISFEDVVTKLLIAHENNNPNVGIDILNKDVCNVQKKQIIDLLITKKFAYKLSTNAVLTILRIDHIIMSKPKGEPKNSQKGHWDDDDDAW